ncbi:hypothetical protein SAMN05192560_1638 [Methylobacillus rhizosphaerae]|uniref:Uncharacterized protein n=1 Tax=Methylobacillus rhizosphaerae TaxID=551994 RepID=A0A239A3A3_9PROT|nr:hypothetical protein [Methylobacillus rhizosphaerae]SNR89598.1 hypothetical protein SAMN05192560_1638 [Methylobacillus rhizosphaerae]
MNSNTYLYMQQLKSGETETATRRERVQHLSPEEMEQTLSEYASHSKLRSRERIRLVTDALTSRLRGSRAGLKQAGKQMVKHVGAKVAHAASHKLMEVAVRIEQRASRLDQEK